MVKLLCCWSLCVSHVLCVLVENVGMLSEKSRRETNHSAYSVNEVKCYKTLVSDMLIVTCCVK